MTTPQEAEQRYEGALAHRDLDDGRVLVLYPMIFTVRLCVGPQDVGWYDRAWCYLPEKTGDAVAALEGWDGNGEPPGGWHKEVGT